MKNKIILSIGLFLGISAIIAIVILSGNGRFFQGALYNLRPIYTSCKIEGGEFSSDKTEDCENFHQKFLKNLIPDGEYTIRAKYTDRKLPTENLIPIRIRNKQLTCTYKESGFQPEVNIASPSDEFSTQNFRSTEEIPVGADGVIARITFTKNDQVYAYDSNICEGSFEAGIFNGNRLKLGIAKLDTNGFFNSRPAVNEIFITNKLYYTDKGGNNLKEFTPGNAYAIINAIPDLTFKFTIACSAQFPTVTIPTVTTSSDSSILFQGINEEFLKTCGTKLYLSLQNSNRNDDVQIINPILLSSLNENTVKYDFKLFDLASINARDTKFPFTYNVKMHMRERSDVNTIQTLGSGILTISKYTPIDYSSNNPDQNANTAEPSPSTSANKIEDTLTNEVTEGNIADPVVPNKTENPAIPENVTPEGEVVDPVIPGKVRHMPEQILVLPDQPADITGTTAATAEGSTTPTATVPNSPSTSPSTTSEPSTSETSILTNATP